MSSSPHPSHPAPPALGRPEEEITEIEIPTGVPLVYKLDSDLKPIRGEGTVGPLSGEFLGDPEAIAAAQKAVANQGAAKTADGDDVKFLCIGSGCLMLSNEELEQAFADADTDGDGLLTKGELQSCAAKLSDEEGVLSDVDADEIFKLVDRDGDGKIDFPEFVQAMTAEK